jgi:hypothetical protein
LEEYGFINEKMFRIVQLSIGDGEGCKTVRINKLRTQSISVDLKCVPGLLTRHFQEVTVG